MYNVIDYIPYAAHYNSMPRFITGNLIVLVPVTFFTHLPNPLHLATLTWISASHSVSCHHSGHLSACRLQTAAPQRSSPPCSKAQELWPSPRGLEEALPSLFLPWVLGLSPRGHDCSPIFYSSVLPISLYALVVNPPS